MSNNKFLIKEIKITNFRGFCGEYSFPIFRDEDEGRRLVLITGPNGYGKSSLLDAIEWCLTGSIKRVVNYCNSKKSDLSSIKSQEGLLRNINCSNSEPVKVELIGKFGEKKVSIIRLYNDRNDYGVGLNGNGSSLSIKIDDKIILEDSNDPKSINNIEFIQYPITDYFYERFVCSFEKAIEIYEKGRADLYDMFSLFLGGTDNIELAEKNLKGYLLNENKKATKDNKVIGLIEQVDTVISDMEEISEKKNKELEELNNQLKKVKENLNEEYQITEYIKKYSGNLIFKGELTALEIDKIEDIKQKKEVILYQRNVLNDISIIFDRQKAYKNACSLIKGLKAKSELEYFTNNFYNPFNERIKEVEKAQNKNEELLIKQRNEYQKSKIDISKIGTDYDNDIKTISEKIEIYYSNKEKESKFQQLDDLKKEVNEYHNIRKELALYSNVSNSTKALRALVDNISGFKEYRDNSTTKECPLCGSKEMFGNDSIELARIAIKELGEIDKKRAELQKDFNYLSDTIKNAIFNFANDINKHIDSRISLISEELEAIKNTIDIRNLCGRYNLNFDDINIEILNKKLEEMNNYYNQVGNIDKLQASFLESISDSSGCLKDIFDKGNSVTKEHFIGWVDQNKIDSLQSFIKLHEEREKKVEFYEYADQIGVDEVAIRISILDAMKKALDNSQELSNIVQKIEECKKEIKAIEEKIKFKKNVKEKLSYIEKKIEDVRNDYDRKACDRLGSSINLFYKRINRHTIFKDLIISKVGSTKKTDGKVITINNKEVNFSNIISTGQMTTVMLSFFLTVAMGQRHLPFRCYFMDDPVQSMDDINILSFIDLLRVEMSSDNKIEDRFADQLYFATCDEDIENLIVHKARHFGLNCTHIKFNGYSVYKSIYF